MQGLKFFYGCFGKRAEVAGKRAGVSADIRQCLLQFQDVVIFCPLFQVVIDGGIVLKFSDGQKNYFARFTGGLQKGADGNYTTTVNLVTINKN